MNCAALHPVPMTPTRLPVRSTSWSHRAEWNDGPAKSRCRRCPGSAGRLSCPTALMTASAANVVSPSGPSSSSVHRRASSSHVALETSVPKRMCSPMPNSSTHCAEVVVQLGLGRVGLRPVVALRERVAVVVVRDVDPAARVGVLEPGAADVGVLLEHRTDDAGLLEPVRGGDAGHAGADDRDAEVAAGGELGPVHAGPGGRCRGASSSRTISSWAATSMAAGHPLDELSRRRLVGQGAAGPGSASRYPRPAGRTQPRRRLGRRVLGEPEVGKHIIEAASGRVASSRTGRSPVRGRRRGGGPISLCIDGGPEGLVALGVGGGPVLHERPPTASPEPPASWATEGRAA